MINSLCDQGAIFITGEKGSNLNIIYHGQPLRIFDSNNITDSIVGSPGYIPRPSDQRMNLNVFLYTLDILLKIIFHPD